jgi:hypothetical protein
MTKPDHAFNDRRRDLLVEVEEAVVKDMHQAFPKIF